MSPAGARTQERPAERLRRLAEGRVAGVARRVESLVAELEVDAAAPEALQAVEDSLHEVGLAVDPPLDGLRPDDLVVVYLDPAGGAKGQGGAKTGGANAGAATAGHEQERSRDARPDTQTAARPRPRARERPAPRPKPEPPSKRRSVNLNLRHKRAGGIGHGQGVVRERPEVQLRRLVEARRTPIRPQVDTLMRLFSLAELTGETRRQMQQALTEVGLRVEPSLERSGRRDLVFLSLIGEAPPDAGNGAPERASTFVVPPPPWRRTAPPTGPDAKAATGAPPSSLDRVPAHDDRPDALEQPPGGGASVAGRPPQPQSPGPSVRRIPRRAAGAPALDAGDAAVGSRPEVQLRRLAEGRVAGVRRQVTILLRLFDLPELTDGAREQMETALGSVGLASRPSLADVGPRDVVRITLAGEAGEAGGPPITPTTDSLAPPADSLAPDARELRTSDAHAAQQIRSLAQARSGGLRRKVSTLLRVFQLPELTDEARERMQRSLTGSGLRVDPPLTKARADDFVLLSMAAEAVAPGAPGATPPREVAWPVPAEEPRRRSRLRRALPVALVVFGVLMLAEAALTVFWQEPFTALKTARAQKALAGDLDALAAREGATERVRGARRIAAYMSDRAVTLNRGTADGEPIGRLKIDGIGLDMVVVQGTSEGPLQKGPAHYTETPLPGAKLPAGEGNHTVGIAGHRTTYEAPFRNVNELDAGDEIVFTTPYGRFTYATEKTKIVDDQDPNVFVSKGDDGGAVSGLDGATVGGSGRIALTACHPLYSDAQRIIVYGRLKKVEPLGAARQARRPGAPGTLDF